MGGKEQEEEEEEEKREEREEEEEEKETEEDKENPMCLPGSPQGPQCWRCTAGCWILIYQP